MIDIDNAMESKYVRRILETGKEGVLDEARKEGISTKLVLERFRNRRIKKYPISIITSIEDVNFLLSYFSNDTYRIALLFSTSENKIISIINKIVLSDSTFYNLYIVKNMSYLEIAKEYLDYPSITPSYLKRRNIKLKYTKSTQNSMAGLKNKYLSNPEKIKKASEKRAITNTERYGSPVPLKNSSILEKTKNTNLKRYGVSNVGQVKEYNKKRAQTILKKWGASNFKSSNYFRSECLSNTFFKTKWVNTPEEAIGLLTTDNKDGVMNSRLRGMVEKVAEERGVKKLTLTDVANIIGVPYSYINSSTRSPAYISIDGNPILYSNRTGEENELGEYLNSLNVTFIRNKHYEELNGMQLDYYIPEKKVALEFNGAYYHATEGSQRGKRREYHNEKTELARSNMGVTVFHVWSYDWENPVRKSILKSQIAYMLNSKQIKKIYARKTTIKPIEASEARTFFEYNHIQGGAGSEGSVRYGLFDQQGELVAAMSFGRRYRGKEYWELIRYANKKFTTTVGGASKLLAQFEKEYPDKSIISYLNRDFGKDINRSMYTKIGFVYQGRTKEGYHWIRTKDNLVINRQKVTPKNLVRYTEGTRIEPFTGATRDFRKIDTKETEKSYMLRNGFLRVYNAGNDIYIKEKSL